VSRDTLLRQVMALPEAQAGPVVVLGDRKAATLRAWLEAHSPAPDSRRCAR